MQCSLRNSASWSAQTRANFCWRKSGLAIAAFIILHALSATRIALPEYAQFGGAIAEIQVRTVLQHAWAEIEHDIQYKSTSVIPVQIRRRFIALAGMLEIADREFQAVQDEDHRLREQARTRIDEGDLERVEITPDALKAFLDKSVGRDDRISSFSYDFLARILRRLGFKTLRQLEECTKGFNDDQLSRFAYGARQGQVTRFELMLLAGMGKLYIERHPWAKDKWFTDRHAHILEQFKKRGVDLREYNPVVIDPPSTDAK
jgi:putative GTP pyrophosphokinase